MDKDFLKNTARFISKDDVKKLEKEEVNDKE